MRVDTIRLTSATEDPVYTGEPYLFVNLPVDRAEPTDPYILQQAYGLDVGEAFPQFYGSFARQDFRKMMMKPREVTLKIRLNPDHTLSERPSDLRHSLYKLISYDREGLVEIQFVADGEIVAYLRGFVTKLEAPQFASEPQAQITIECPFPFIRGKEEIELVGEPGVTVPSPYLIDNESNMPHGFQMVLRFTASVPTSFTIQGEYGTTKAPFKILRNPGAPFLNNDRLYFSSTEDDKYLYMTRGGNETLLADFIDRNQVWPLMFPGSNRIQFSTSNVVIESLTYYTHYWGI